MMRSLPMFALKSVDTSVGRLVAGRERPPYSPKDAHAPGAAMPHLAGRLQDR
jgi:hypothetical protein